MTTIDSLAIVRLVLISSVLTGGVVLWAALFQRVFSRAAASVRHAVWLATIVVALALPAAAALAPMEWGARSSVLDQAIRVNDVSVVSSGQDAVNDAPSLSPPPVMTIDRSAVERVARLFIVVWLVGIAGVLLQLIGSAIRLRSVIRSARPLNDRVLADCLPASCDHVTIRQSGAVDLPLTAGVLRPLILLPEAAVDSWSNRRLRVALLHEAAHVQRRDVAWQIAGRIACALQWFNPLVWFAARQCARAAEQACDNAVLDAGVRPSSYAGHLLEIARWASGRNAFALAVGQGSELEGRITAVLAPTRARRGLTRVALQRVVWVAALSAVAAGTHRMMRLDVAQAEPARPVSRPHRARRQRRAGASAG